MTNGSEIAGRYRIERRLGLGGMSTVHLALDTRLERPVAVKLLAEHLADDPTFVSRFQREALAAARLVHPNVVQVFDSGLDPASGRHFIVMEYVEGQSLAEILRDKRQLGVDEALAIVVQACHGLDYAHRQGVIHRDVKPGNLLRSADGMVKLADFGIARAADQASITQAGSVLGTASYLAPEQATGEEVGPRADLYSLGVVTYQSLAGRLPYEASSLSELVLKQQREAPPNLDSLNGEVTPELAQAVAIALSIHPSGRYESARTMGDALDSAAQGIPPDEATAATQIGGATDVTSIAPRRQATAEQPRVVAREPVARRRPAPVAPAAPPAARQRPRATKRGRRVLRGLTVLLVLAIIGAAAAVAIVSSMSDSQRVHLRNVVQQTVNDSVDAMKQLVSDNTR